MISSLIASPSISSTSSALDMGNRLVNEQLATWLQALGFATRIIDVHPAADKTNLIATLGSGPGGLILAGHTDTVPMDEALWSSDPFRLKQTEQRLYGLGTTDMKAFLALAVEAASRVDANKLQQPLTILATADEETGMAGARALSSQDELRDRVAVIGEPTGLHPIYTHKGMLMEAISVHGQSGHSSDPALGNNALEGMHRVIQALLQWRQRLQARYQDAVFHIPGPTLNLGHIHGGDNPNRICGDCELHIDLRPIPGMQLDELRMELQQVARQALQNTGLEISFRGLMEPVPPMQTPLTADIVRAAEQQTGYTATSAAFGTEGPFLNALDTNTVILGPGDIAQAHQPDEYLALDRIDPMLNILDKLITRFCLRDPS